MDRARTGQKQGKDRARTCCTPEQSTEKNKMTVCRHSLHKRVMSVLFKWYFSNTRHTHLSLNCIHHKYLSIIFTPCGLKLFYFPLSITCPAVLFYLLPLLLPAGGFFSCRTPVPKPALCVVDTPKVRPADALIPGLLKLKPEVVELPNPEKTRQHK